MSCVVYIENPDSPREGGGKADEERWGHPPEQRQADRSSAVGAKGQPRRAREPSKGCGAVLSSVADVDAQDRERRSEHHCRTDDRH
jgi:hypothetical protein